MTDRQRTAALTDDALPVLPELLTDRVPGPLAAAVAAAEGTVVAVRVSQVTWWPGRSATVSWDTVVEGGPLAGRATYVGTTQPPPQGAVVVLLASLPDRSKAQIWEKLKKKTTSVEFAPFAAADVPGWLIARAEEQGVEFETPAARALAGAIGTALGVLTQELAKLIDYVGERKRITKDDVAEIVGSVPRQNRWDWFDMVSDGRFAEARAGLHVLLDESESGVGLVIGLGTQFLRLAIVARGGERALGEVLPPHQRWLGKRLAKQARAWHPEALDRALGDLLRADRLLKSASLDERQIMEELLLRLQQRAQKAAA